MGASSLKTGVDSYRPTWAEIDLKLLEQNILKLKSYLVSSGTRIMAVVKADAYGHGAVRLTRYLEGLGVAWFGVSSVEEAVGLRKAGCRGNILILGSLFPFRESFEAALGHDLIPTISSLEAARQLLGTVKPDARKIRVHLKMETGMQRIGVRPETCAQIAALLKESDAVAIDGVYTHFSSAKDEEYTRRQLQEFNRGLSLLGQKGVRPACVHAANSAAAVRWPQAHFNMIRCGLALYGETPEFEPILSVKTRVVFVKKVPAGTPVSYERTFTTPRESVLATLPIGYADGLPISASGRARVLINGHAAPVAGAITMDMTVVDVTDVAGVGVGSEAVVIGTGGDQRIEPGDWADWGRMSVYELLCRFGAPRLAKVYLEAD
ncbi:MAG: alanine racemase [Elusimicrobia bacterium]|nr:alanine racemase [Elusimicrobiota bacterium]